MRSPRPGSPPEPAKSCAMVCSRFGLGYPGLGNTCVYLPYWFVTLALAAPPALIARRWRTTRRRAQEGRCPICGYDLRATPERCPECGTPAKATPERSAHQAPSHLQVSNL